MPTNEERRKVSAGLRSCGIVDTGHKHHRYSFKGDICGCMLVGSSDTAVRAATAFLAGLIEPEPERTCHVIDHETSCDDCQCEKWSLSCGHEVMNESDCYPPSYCSECGAKVVE